MYSDITKQYQILLKKSYRDICCFHNLNYRCNCILLGFIMQSKLLDSQDMFLFVFYKVSDLLVNISYNYDIIALHAV